MLNSDRVTCLSGKLGKYQKAYKLNADGKVVTLSPCAFSSGSSSDQHDVPPPLSSFHGRLPQLRQIHSSSFMYFIHPLFSWSTSFSSSFSTFIPVLSCISSIHFFLGRPLFLLPSSHAIIISFSNPFDLMICPKNPSFLLIAICCNVSSFSTPIFRRTSSFVFFSIHDILCIFLHIHISQALIFFSKFFVIVHVSQPYNTVGKIIAPTSLFLVSMLTCLSFHIFSIPWSQCSFSYRYSSFYFHITLSLIFYY